MTRVTIAAALTLALSGTARAENPAYWITAPMLDADCTGAQPQPGGVCWGFIAGTIAGVTQWTEKPERRGRGPGRALCWATINRTVIAALAILGASGACG
jgi:hypothetical protein